MLYCHYVVTRTINLTNSRIVIGNAGIRFTVAFTNSSATVACAVSISNAAAIISCITVAPVAAFARRNQTYVPFSLYSRIFLRWREKS